mmetsp:Transcript_54789/g.133039  ORF Transcript_54789/g.133039 Transcript_54789/m.133039 type:complete len:252 (-) Transcript_54789:281-1036(-)
MSTSSSSTLDARLAVLETKIIGGKQRTPPSIRKTDDDDIPSRLSKLQSQVEKKLQQQHQQQSQSSSSSSQQQVPLRELWFESQQILKELDPGTALTHHTQHQPVLFKRQQVLAAANDLQADMKQLDELSKLLLTGTNSKPSSSSSSSKSNMVVVSQAPILTSDNYTSTTVPQTQERFDNLRMKILSLTRRTQLLEKQLSSLMESYHTTVVAVSEKCILAEETIQQHQKQKQNQKQAAATTSGGQPSSEGSS